MQYGKMDKKSAILAGSIFAMAIVLLLYPQDKPEQPHRIIITTIDIDAFEFVEVDPLPANQYYQAFINAKNITYTAQVFDMTVEQFVFKMVSESDFDLMEWCSKSIPEYYGAGSSLGISEYRKCDLFGDRYLISFWPNQLIDHDSFVKTNCDILTDEYLLCNMSGKQLLLEKDK